MTKESMPLTHPDRLAWFRNVNLLGAGALVLAGVYLPALQAGLNVAAVINVAQAGGTEALRQQKLGKTRK